MFLIRSSANYSLVLPYPCESIITAMYFDDVGISGDDSKIEEMVSKRRKLFSITNPGWSTIYLGVGIALQDDRILLLQAAYTQVVIKAKNTFNARTTEYPLLVWHILYKRLIDESLKYSVLLYIVLLCSVLGAVLYSSTRTRPDIRTAARMIAHFEIRANISSSEMVKNVVAYLTRTNKS